MAIIPKDQQDSPLLANRSHKAKTPYPQVPYRAVLLPPNQLRQVARVDPPQVGWM